MIIFSIVRSFVASYLFLSGYGYTMQTLSAKNGENGLFFIFRCYKIILKLFFLPSLLSFATSTPVTLYYVVILHGFHTLILVSVLSSVGSYFNLQEQKIGLLFLLCFHIFVVTALHQPIFIEQVIEPSLRYIFDSSTINVMFRLQLDKFATVYGVAAAVLETSFQLSPKDEIKKYVRHSVYLVAVMSALIWPWIVFNAKNQNEYLQCHVYGSLFAILLYLAFRRLPCISNYISLHLVWIGERSFAVYLLQFHFFLVDKATKIPSFLNKNTYPCLNFIVGIFIYVCFVWRVDTCVKEILRYLI